MNENKKFDLKVILKYSIVGIVLSLLLGTIFYYLFSFTIYKQVEYAYNMFLGIFPFSFCIGLMITLLILTPHIKNMYDSIIVGFIIGLFTGLLQNTVIVSVYGGQQLMYFLEFVGNQTILLIILGVIFAYIGNAYLKGKINTPHIN
ncbi:hypothetical protein [Methanobrevibacter sp.]|uniref:hypothetical protein n=1 Tax=Methanobrevibacter sp. TaxID=66852 RepID=UPI00388EA6CA